MLLATINTWNECEKILEQLKPEAIWYIIDFYNRMVTIRFTDGLVIYEFSSLTDDYPPCDIYDYRPAVFTEDDSLVEVEGVLFGEKIKYLVGCQKLNGVDLWCVYSNYEEVVRPVVIERLKLHAIPIEGLISEISESVW
ncbi:MAG: hypothetical protein NDF54_05815 [archaeon GB-1867-035]|nr:hypothetical protein [Candidatus Culexmicrobium profundum]